MIISSKLVRTFLSTMMIFSSYNANGLEEKSVTPKKMIETIVEPQEGIELKDNLDNAYNSLIDSDAIQLNNISTNTLKTFVSVIDLVRRRSYNEVNDEYLFSQAISGMLKKIDPYAEFLDELGYENLRAFSEGQLAHVGIVTDYDYKNKSWIINEIEHGSPADNSRLKVGDYLVSINNFKLTGDLTKRDVDQLLKGMAGTKVELKVSNKGRSKRTLILQRVQIDKTHTRVESRNGIVVITLPVFQKSTCSEIIQGLSLINEPIKRVLIDVRNNPGGVLESAISVVSLIQPEGDVVLIEDKNGLKNKLSVHGDELLLKDMPIVILQNRYSASASEVLASGLQFNGLATIVGETSYGKGSIQEILPINEKQAVKLTVAHYLQLDGQQIDGVGVKADIELSGDESTWLDQAINILNNKT